MRTNRICSAALTVAAVGGMGWSATVHADAAPPGTRAAPRTTVVASGLDVPKYLTFGPGGLYVTESGTGGRSCIDVVSPRGNPTSTCTGATGRVVRIDRSGRQHTVVRGLASTVERDNGEVQGPMAVAFAHRRAVVLERGAYVGPSGHSAIPGRLGRHFGTLRSFGGHDIADFKRFAIHHPQPAATMGGLPGELTYDTDAHDVAAYRHGWAVADAGANDVLWVGPTDKVSLITRLPTTTETAPAGALGPGSPEQVVHAQAVPSSVAVGPHGALYVATLGGVPGLPRTESVYRIAKGHAPVQVVDGLTRVNDLAFDRRGRLLVLEAKVGGTPAPASSPGAILRATLTPGRVVTAQRLPVSGLSAPTGLAVGRDGAVYVSNRTTTPGQGQVLRITGLG